MNIPEFTAEASLYRTNRRYRSLGQVEYQETSIIPQLGGKGFKGLSGCIDDCQDLHPSWPGFKCALSCRDPNKSDPSSDSWFNDLLSNFGIGFFEGACSATSGSPFLCRKVGDYIRGQS